MKTNESNPIAESLLRKMTDRLLRERRLSVAMSDNRAACRRVVAESPTFFVAQVEQDAVRVGPILHFYLRVLDEQGTMWWHASWSEEAKKYPGAATEKYYDQLEAQLAARFPLDPTPPSSVRLWHPRPTWVETWHVPDQTLNVTAVAQTSDGTSYLGGFADHPNDQWIDPQCILGMKRPNGNVDLFHAPESRFCRIHSLTPDSDGNGLIGGTGNAEGNVISGSASCGSEIEFWQGMKAFVMLLQVDAACPWVNTWSADQAHISTTATTITDAGNMLVAGEADLWASGTPQTIDFAPDANDAAPHPIQPGTELGYVSTFSPAINFVDFDIWGPVKNSDIDLTGMASGVDGTYVVIGTFYSPDGLDISNLD